MKLSNRIALRLSSVVYIAFTVIPLYLHVEEDEDATLTNLCQRTRRTNAGDTSFHGWLDTVANRDSGLILCANMDRWLV